MYKVEVNTYKSKPLQNVMVFMRSTQTTKEQVICNKLGIDSNNNTVKCILGTAFYNVQLQEDNALLFQVLFVALTFSSE